MRRGGLCCGVPGNAATRPPIRTLLLYAATTAPHPLHKVAPFHQGLSATVVIGKKAEGLGYSIVLPSIQPTMAMQHERNNLWSEIGTEFYDQKLTRHSDLDSIIGQ